MKKIEAPFIESFIEVNRFFNSNNIRYCLIGGLAAGFWGEPRYTQGMDFTVAMKEDNLDFFLRLLKDNGFIFLKKGSNLIQIQKKNRLKFQADLILSETEYQEWVVSRAISVRIFETNVSICSPEDLIILKLLTNRRQDLLDVENILKKRAGELDQDYLTKWLGFWKLKSLFKKEFKSFISKGFFSDL